MCEKEMLAIFYLYFTFILKKMCLEHRQYLKISFISQHTSNRIIYNIRNIHHIHPSRFSKIQWLNAERSLNLRKGQTKFIHLITFKNCFPSVQ